MPAAGRWRRFWDAVGLTGRALITLSILMVLFVGYQLWGTNLITAWEQRALKSEFQDLLDEQESQAESAETAIPEARPAIESAPTTAPELDPFVGDVIGLVEIPALDLEHAIVEGVDMLSLRRGPGHYPHTTLPGHQGNAAIAGHRTTYGAPFNEIDELERGDEVLVTTVQGTFTYRVTEQVIVSPSDVEVIRDTRSPTLTLTTCNPEFSSRERLVVHAELVGDPVDAPRRDVGPEGRRRDGQSADTPSTAPTSLDGEHSSGWSGVDRGLLFTASLLAGIGALWWWAFRRRRKVTTWLAGAPPFLVALFFFFTQLEGLLPSSY